jgi:hypothetical protein
MAPSLNDFRALAAALPPSERVFGGEVADMVSALAAVLTHGEPIIQAARNGVEHVHEFFHQKAVEHAQTVGAPEPERGTQPPSTVAPPSGVGIDYDQLAAALVRAQASPPAPVQTSGSLL